LGINTILQPFDNKTYRAKLNLRTFSSFLTSWSADYPDSDSFLSIFLSDSGNNRTGWKNSSFDEKVIRARYLQNSKEREKLYFEMQKILIQDEAVIVPLYHEPNQH